MTWPAFTHPWMLAALAAAGLPVLIHFLTKARPRRVAFPPYRFLTEACAGQQAIHRLRTLILLLVRCLAIAALVLWFARPYWKAARAGANPEASRRAVLVLDTSLSMRAVVQGVTLFSRAQAEASDILRALPAGSEAAVVLAGHLPQPILPALSRNIPALHDALVSASPTYEQGDPAAALALARRLLGDGAGSLYILSDFQESNWGSVTELPSGTQCQLRPVAKDPVPNVGITSVRLLPTEPVAGEPTQVLCTVFNSSHTPREETVRLQMADTTQETRVTCQPFASAPAVFNVRFARPGVFTGRVSLPPDDLREDDTRHLVVRVHQALSILLVSDAEASDARSAAFFVARALTPSAESAPGFRVIRRHSQDTDRGVLETSEVFVLVSPATLTGEASEIIGRRVQEGAQLLAVLDGPTAAALIPAALRPPLQLLQTVTSTEGEPLLPGPRRLLPELDTSDWTALRVHRHWQSAVLDGRSDEMLLAYPDGSPAWMLSSAGRGKLACGNVPLTPEGSDLIGHPLFPALLHETLRWLRQGQEDRALSPGEAWTLEAAQRSEQPVQVLDPMNRPVSARSITSGRLSRLAMPTAREPGCYVARQGDELIGGGAVNVDGRESDTRPMALAKLKPGPGATVAVADAGENLAVSAQDRPLWPHLAAATLLLLAAEMALLACWRRPITPARPAPAAPEAHL